MERAVFFDIDRLAIFSFADRHPIRDFKEEQITSITGHRFDIDYTRHTHTPSADATR